VRNEGFTAFAAWTTFLPAITRATDTFEAVLLETSGLPVLVLLMLWAFFVALPLTSDFFSMLMDILLNSNL
jgi:hypothetical protein